MLSKGGGRPISVRVNVVLNAREPCSKTDGHSELSLLTVFLRRHRRSVVAESKIHCSTASFCHFATTVSWHPSDPAVPCVLAIDQFDSSVRWRVFASVPLEYQRSRRRTVSSSRNSLDIVFITCRRSSIRNCQLKRDRPPPSGLPLGLLLFFLAERISGIPSAACFSLSLEWI